MASSTTRRPLPALISLLALLLLTALVWWRVTNRDSGHGADAATTCPTPTATTTTTTTTAASPKTLPPQKTIDVLVLNSTSRSGIAGKARAALVADGFRSTEPAANDTSKYKVTGSAQIRYDAASKQAATLLEYYFPTAQLLQVTASSPMVTVSLGPKYTSVESQKTVTAKLAADKVVLRTVAASRSAARPSSAPASC